MSAPTNHWKLGLFVVVGGLIATGAFLYLGATSLQAKDAVRYESYFDESVQGLDVGAPVKFRGVTIGEVSEIGIAEDNRHVVVSCDLEVKALNALGLSVERSKGILTKMKIPPDLRVQLGSSGITGVKFIQIDFFKPGSHPLLVLPFQTPDNYIPAAPSMMKNIENSVVDVVDRFPPLADQVLAVLSGTNVVVGDLERAKLPARVGSTLDQIDALVRESRQTIALLNPILARAGGESGLVMSLQRTSDAVGGVAESSSNVGPALEETLREVQAAATSVQRLADALERDPDMLLKGRAKRVDP